MIALPGGFIGGRRAVVLCVLTALPIGLSQPSARAIDIVVDYRYDTNNFFNTPEKRATIEAAASRYSAVITTSLAAVSLNNDALDPRIGFTHPGLGISYQVSPATGEATDAVVSAGNSAANEYRQPWSIAANQWILYVGGRPLSTTSEGGTKTGFNFPNVYTNSASHVNRGFRQLGGLANLPVWGGSVSFDSDGSTRWHYNHTTAPPAGAADLYSFALHEIGHALGLNTSSWTEWTSHIAPGTRQYSGSQAVDAYNADNGAARNTLNVHAASPLNPHWQNNAFDSLIFQNASANLIGSVGAGALQDLLMEPALEAGRRLELTNVDVAALRDVGWRTVPQIIIQPGDFNGNGAVDSADYIPISKGLATGTYTTWRANYGESLPPTSPTADSSHVPEPDAILILTGLCVVLIASPRKNRGSGECCAPAHYPSVKGAWRWHPVLWVT